ncbi:MAG TPA: PAS domain S-box protein [Methanospirillum sp.]|nr:PAS domain S-box protein [Methanospirillum sp.]
MTDKVHILYVDDEPDLLTTGKLFLERLGDFHVTPSSSASEAIAFLKEHSFDVIISDYQMPHMDGIAFLKHLKAEGNLTPFILLTARGREDVVIEALNNGAAFYLEKGLDVKVHFTELSHQIRSIVLHRRAEKELRESEKRVADIINFLPDATFAIDIHGIVIAWNRAMEMLTGVSGSDMLGKGDYEYALSIYHERRPILIDLVLHDNPEIASTYQVLKREGLTLVAESSSFSLYNGRGGTFWFTATPLYNTEGDIVGAIESIRDITARKIIEETLRENEERLLMAQEIGQNGCWEYNPKTNMIWGSAEGLRIFGFPPIAGEISIDEIEACIPDRKQVHQALVDLISLDHVYDLEYIIHPADGSASRYIHSVGRLERDNEGSVRRVRGIIQDITTRKEAELKLLRRNAELFAAEEELKHQYNSLVSTDEILRQTKDYLENLISIANVPIIVWDPAFRITRLNHAFELVIGRSADEVIGHSLEFLFPPDQADRSMRLFQTTLDGVRWETTEIDIMHRDGSLRTLLWNSATLYTQDGLSPVATIAQGHDVTDERRLEQEKEIALAQIKQNLAQLAILNDEIRNPLTLITLNADTLSDRLVSDQIFEQTRRIDEMINQLDKRWMESDKILDYLQKHHKISFDSPLEKVFPSKRTGDNLIEEVQAQLYTILDSIDALVYVADMKNHDLLFINRRGRSKFGDITGKKCYKSIQNNQEGPCSFCTNHLLIDKSGPTGVHRWEYQNTRNGRWYDCRDRAIRWSDGRLVRLEIATDITDRKFAEVNVRKSEGPVQRNLGAVLSPEENIEHFTLTDIIDLPEVQHLISDFYSITGIAVGIFDLKGNTLISEGWQDVCTQFHRLHPEASQNCLESNTYLAQGVIPGTFRICKCKNNLWHVSTPIVVGGLPLGNLFIGQFFFDDEEPDYSLFRDQAKQYGFDPDAYLTAINRVARVSRKKIDTVMQFYTRFIHLIAQVSWNNIKLARTIHERDALLISVQESEEKFRSYINNAPNGVFVVDEKGRYLEVNPAACAITGYSEDDLLQMQIFALLPPESYVLAEKHFQQLVEKGRAIGEFVFRHKDGSLRSWVVDAVQITPTRFIGFVQDTTERRQVEESLRASEEKYRQLIEHANNAIGIVQECQLQLVNPRMVELTGYQESDLLSNRFSMFIHPDDREMVVERYCRRIRGEDPPSRYTFRLITKENNVTWVEISAVVIEWEGQPATLNFLIDITDRKRAEDALLESMERYRILSENAPVGVLACDRDGRITYLNPKVLEHLGSQSEEKTKEVNLLVFPPLVESGFSQILSEVLITGKPALSIEFKYTSIWGKTVHYLGHISPLTKEGHVYGALIILDDITDRQKDEEALRESNQKLRMLTSLTRHDIFNQLSAVELFQNLALQTTELTKIQRYITQAQEAGELIEKTIGFTREYENFGIVSSGWQRIYELIESAKSEVSFGTVKTDNKIPQDLEVYADPIIRKVFTTLLENAIRHGGKITRILFTCHEETNSLIITCEDDGNGILLDEKELIFDHGYGKNTGIGLFLAREILSITGLSIRECGKTGEGSKFEILVPEGKYRSHPEDGKLREDRSEDDPGENPEISR